MYRTEFVGNRWEVLQEETIAFGWHRGAIAFEPGQWEEVAINQELK